MVLEIGAYRSAEETAVARLTNRQIQAFSPHGFRAVGYPADVTSDAEVVRYVDALHEHNRSPYLSADFLYSAEERSIYTSIVHSVANVTRSAFGREICPVASLLTSVDLFRLICHLRIALGRELRVLEIGPGSGYLSAALALNGFKVVALENASGFYLWQHMLFDAVSDSYVDIALDSYRGEALVHMPWWSWADLWETPGSIGPVDIVVSDAVLSEMHRFARLYLWRIFKEISRSSPCAMIVTGRPGQPIHGTFEEWTAEAVASGYEPVCSDEISILAPAGKSEAVRDHICRLLPAKRLSIPPFGDALHPCSAILGEVGQSADQRFWSYLGL